MELLAGIAVLAAFVIICNILSMVIPRAINFFLSRGDIRDQAKIVDAPTPQMIANILTPEQHGLLWLAATGTYMVSPEHYETWDNDFHTPGFVGCLQISPDPSVGFVVGLSPIGHAVLGILDERRIQEGKQPAKRTALLKQRMDETAQRIDERCQHIEDRLAAIAGELKEMVRQANLDAPTEKARKPSRRRTNA